MPSLRSLLPLSPSCWQILHPPFFLYPCPAWRVSLVLGEPSDQSGWGCCGGHCGVYCPLWARSTDHLSWSESPSLLPFGHLSEPVLFWFGNIKKVNNIISTELYWTLPVCQSLMTGGQGVGLSVQTLGSGGCAQILASTLTSYEARAGCFAELQFLTCKKRYNNSI